MQEPGMGNSVREPFLHDFIREKRHRIRRAVIDSNGIGPIMAEKPFGQERPWGHEFMDLLYHNTPPGNPLEKYIDRCISGQAVRNRKHIVVKKTSSILSSPMTRRNHVPPAAKIVNLGSAYGDDMFELLEKYPGLNPFTTVINIDIAGEAVQQGQQAARKKNMKNISFVQGDILKLHRRINGADLALFIGMLCGVGHAWGVRMLKSSMKFLRPGGILMGACVTDRMVRKDLFTCFILEKILGWHLCYKKPADVEKMFRDAGLEYQGDFTEGKDRFYCIGIGGVGKDETDCAKNVME